MDELDKLMKEQFIPFRERVTKVIQSKHPYIMSMFEQMTLDGHNKVGMRITEGGQMTGEYTIHLTGTKITHAEPGKLDAEFHHPILGLMKPYIVIERQDLERFIADEDSLKAEFYSALPKHLPDFTVKFMQ